MQVSLKKRKNEEQERTRKTRSQKLGINNSFPDESGEAKVVKKLENKLEMRRKPENIRDQKTN